MKNGNLVWHNCTPSKDNFVTVGEADYHFKPEIPSTVGRYNGKICSIFQEGDPTPLAMFRPFPWPRQKDVEDAYAKQFIEYHNGLRLRNAFTIWKIRRNDIATRLLTVAAQDDLGKKMGIIMILSVVTLIVSILSALISFGS
jgi:hypothetical protein